MKSKTKKKPSIFIMCDMEGISGISQIAQVNPEAGAYALGRQYMTWDVNACVEGCFRGGAGRVVVRDAHWAGFNILWDEMDGRAELIQGRSPLQRITRIEDFDAVMLLGYHVMAGVRHGVLEHTMSSKSWQNFWMNDIKCGEIAIEAGIAGDHGLPIIFVSGDDKTCAEARQFLPETITVQVKQGLDLQGAQLLPKNRAHEMIRDGAEKAVGQLHRVPPYKVSKPVRMRLELVSRTGIPSRRPGLKIIDGRTVEVTAPTVEEALYQLP